jgi:RNA polymerase sigma-70 factor (ECF subfamily)
MNDSKYGIVGDQVQAVVEGDPNALSAILEAFHVELVTHLTGRIARAFQSVLSVDDVLQVTYLEVFMRIRQFRPGTVESLLRWLKKSADHNLIDAVRLLKADKRPPPARAITAPVGADSFTNFVAGLAGTGTSPPTAAGRSDLQSCVEAALKELPPIYADVIRNYDLEGKSIDEVCKIVGRSRGAVHMLRVRAHERMRELLGTASKYFSSGA